MLAQTFPGLEASLVDPNSPVHPAQRFLASAYDSVSSLIEQSYPALRSQRDGGRGRLTHAEQDLFRAAVVFAGAGVDAVLKQALRSCVPIQILRSSSAREKYIKFVEGYIQDGQPISSRRMARLLIEASPELMLREAYVQRLTGSSLQSQEQVTVALAAMGLEGRQELFKESKDLNDLFKTRNQIAHEMDMTLTAVRSRGKRTRHERSLTTYVSMCHTGLNYCQRVLNALEGTLANDGAG